MSRSAEINRKTNETDIKLKLNLDGGGQSHIETDIGFFNHMLTLFARHGFLDLELNARGDTDVDSHHLVEDVGIALGKALTRALGDKTGIARYGQSLLPMEEALVLVACDISGRPYLAFDALFTAERLGSMETEMVEEFFRAVCVNAGLNLHVKMLSGTNNHHIAEAMFKGFGRALAMAVANDPRVNGVLSTKGAL